MFFSLLRQYRNTLKMVNQAVNTATEHDKPILGNVATGLRFSIEYMELGKIPGTRRGITNLSYEQREVPWDPDDCILLKMAALQKKPVSSLSADQQNLLDDLLDILTPREKEAFELVRGQGYSFSEAARLMKITKASAQHFVIRAEKKLHFVIRKPPNSEGVISVDPVLKKPVQRILFAEVM